MSLLLKERITKRRTMRKIILATLFVLCLASITLAQTDQITLTTYYPAPFGMYQEMRVMGKLGVGTTNPQQAIDVHGKVAMNGEQILYRPKAGSGADTSNLILGNGGQSLNSSATNNLFVGLSSGAGNTSGRFNTAVGYEALKANTSGDTNTAFGYKALEENTTEDMSTAVGYQSMTKQTGGGYNVSVGANALYSNVTGQGNTAVGYGAGAGASGQSHSQNTFVGYQAGNDITTGSNNVLIGSGAGDNITTGQNNIIIGRNQDTPTVATSDHLNVGGTIYGDLLNDKVGIGTTSPATRLAVEGPADAQTPTAYFLNANSAPGDYAIAAIQTSGSKATGSISGKGGLFLYTPDSGAYGIYQASANADNYFGGEVGIGTTAPRSKLDVTSNTGGIIARTTPFVTIGGYGSISSSATFKLLGTMLVGDDASFGGNVRVYNNVQIVPNGGLTCDANHIGEIGLFWPTGGTTMSLNVCSHCIQTASHPECPPSPGGMTWVKVNSWTTNTSPGGGGGGVPIEPTFID